MNRGRGLQRIDATFDEYAVPATSLALDANNDIGFLDRLEDADAKEGWICSSCSRSALR